MVKKRVRDPEVLADAPPAQVEGDDSGSDDDVDMVNVEFEWFNFKPDVDFHGLKSLLRQLLDVDSQLFDLSALADLILSQATLGSTVKVDGEDTDAYAFLTILNLHEHREKKVVKDLAQYIAEKSKSSEALAALSSVLASPASQVGLVLAERMINVPSEVAPPMYAMLIDEIEAAVEDKEPYEFTHYLILSKTYNEIESALDQEEAPRTKKSKSQGGKKGRETMRCCSAMRWLRGPSIRGRFQELGIKAQGSLMLIETSRFEGAVKAIGEYLSPPQ
ncbi:Protein BCP1 [Lachnellula subtilissima]|uniref:Protein BCP1 n=1 Tax=Lachnellula subtilissima TaxID=602034 RepID=A0A8H8RED9_9HELO|nr:Protein BCP1 [Lachnellula subtilissima]